MGRPRKDGTPARARTDTRGPRDRTAERQRARDRAMERNAREDAAPKRDWVRLIALGLGAVFGVASILMYFRQRASDRELAHMLEGMQPEVRDMIDRAKALSGEYATLEARITKLEKAGT